MVSKWLWFVLSSPEFDFNNMRSDSNTILYSVIIKSLSVLLDRNTKSLYFILFMFNMSYLSLGLVFYVIKLLHVGAYANIKYLLGFVETSFSVSFF